VWRPGGILFSASPATRHRPHARPQRFREGTPNDITAVVDGALLVDAWDDLILPAELRQAWQPLIDRTRTKLAEAS